MVSMYNKIFYIVHGRSHATLVEAFYLYSRVWYAFNDRHTNAIAAAKFGIAAPASLGWQMG